MVVRRELLADAHVACLDTDSQAARHARVRWSSNTSSFSLLLLGRVSGVSLYKSAASSGLYLGK